MTERKTERGKVAEERNKCANMMAAWIILKDGEIAGRITARYSRTGATTTVTFHMFGDMDNEALCGYRRMTGWGYNRTQTGIIEILRENEEVMREVYGLEFPALKENVLFNWWRDMEKSGYKVIQAI